MLMSWCLQPIFSANIQHNGSIPPHAGASIGENYIDPKIGFSNEGIYLAPHVGSPNVGILHPPYVDAPSVGDLTIPIWGVLYKELVPNLNSYLLPISCANVYFFNISESLKLQCYSCTFISCGTSSVELMHLGSNGYLFYKYGITSCYQNMCHIYLFLQLLVQVMLRCSLSLAAGQKDCFFTVSFATLDTVPRHSSSW
jgi:hypothetical protein